MPRVSTWAKRLARDILQAFLIMTLVTVLVFVIIRLIPGNPAEQVLGQKATPRAVAALERTLGLNRPFLDQVGQYFGGLVRGRLGYSLVEQGVSVHSLVFSGLGVTLAVITLTVLISLLAGIPFGLWSALSRTRGVDISIRGGSVLLLASPPFFIGLILILIVSLAAHILPAGGWGSGWPANLEYVLLPAVALSCYLGPIIARATRQAARHASRQEYVDATLARGISPARVLVHHILPNSLLPLVTLIGLNIGWLLSGAVVVEVVFALPGLGQVLAQAVTELDYPVIQGVAIVSAFVVVAANLLADVLYTVIDPRIREAR